MNAALLGTAVVSTVLLPTDTFDCEAGWTDGWTAEGRDWCCANRGIACDEDFDCDAGAHAGWTEGKKMWCCQRHGVACDGVTPFICSNMPGNWPSAWSSAKKLWCCENKGVACTDPFDCSSGFGDWRAGWSPGRKIWCCRHEEVACQDQYDFAKYPGFVPNRSDLAVIGATSKEAAERCALMPTCKGFTVAGDPPDDGWTSVEVHLKSAWDLRAAPHGTFTSYRKRVLGTASGAASDGDAATRALRKSIIVTISEGEGTEGAAGAAPGGEGTQGTAGAAPGATAQWYDWLLAPVPGTGAEPGTEVESSWDPWGGAGVPEWVALLFLASALLLCCWLCCWAVFGSAPVREHRYGLLVDDRPETPERTPRGKGEKDADAAEEQPPPRTEEPPPGKQPLLPTWSKGGAADADEDVNPFPVPTSSPRSFHPP